MSPGMLVLGWVAGMPFAFVLVLMLNGPLFEREDWIATVLWPVYVVLALLIMVAILILLARQQVNAWGLRQL